MQAVVDPQLGYCDQHGELLLGTRSLLRVSPSTNRSPWPWTNMRSSASS